MDLKLHCKKCGKKRNSVVSVQVQMSDEEKALQTGENPVDVNILKINLRALLKSMSKHSVEINALRKHANNGNMLASTCAVCFTTTAYNITKDFKLQAAV